MNLIRKKSVRKAISTVTGLTMVVWMCGLGMLAPMMALDVSIADERPSVTVDGVTVYDGDLISSNATNPDGTPTYESLDIYISKVVSDTETYKRLVLNPSVFNSYGHLVWGDVAEVSPTVMDSFTTSDLARQDGTDEVYSLVADDDTGTKHWVNLTATQFIDEAGADADSIYTINSTDNGSYTTGGAYTVVQDFIDRTPPADDEVGTGLTVALASDTPASATVPKSATGVVFSKFNVTASSDGAVTLEDVTVTRGGVGASTNFSYVYLYNGSTRLTNAKTVNATTNQAKFNNVNFEVAAGITETISVVAEIGAIAGNSYLEISSTDDITTTATINGSFPIRGNTMTISSTVTAGTVVAAKHGNLVDPYVGQKNVKIAQFKLTAGNEDISFEQVNLIIKGTVSGNDVTNLILKDTSGNELATAAVLTSKDLAEFVLDTPVTITEGNNKIYYVVADLTGESAETIKVYLDERTDLVCTGATYGFGVGVTRDDYDNGSDDGTDASHTTLQGGDVTFTFNGPSAANVAVNSDDVELMDVTLTTTQEITVKRIDLVLTSARTGADTAADAADLLNAALTEANVKDIKIVDANGDTVMGPGSLSLTGSDVAQTISLTDSFTMDAGESITLSVRVDIDNNCSADQIFNVLMDIDTSLDVEDANGDTVPAANIVPSSDIQGNGFTTTTASLALSSDSSVQSATKVVGSEVNLVSIGMTAAEGSDIEVDQIVLTGYVAADGDNVFLEGVDTDPTPDHYFKDVVLSMKLYAGSVADANQIGTVKSANSLGKVTFDNLNWTISAGDTTKLYVTGVLTTVTAYTTGNADEIKVDIETASTDVTAYDKDGNDAAVTGNAPNTGTANTGAQILLSSGGTLAIDIPTNTPNSDIVVMGTSDSDFSKIKFTATREDFVVSKFAMKNTYGTLVGDYDNNIVSVSVTYPTDATGGTPETKICNLSSGVVTCTGLNLLVPNPDIAGNKKYATVDVKVEVQTDAEGATAADAPGFTFSFADDLVAVGQSSGTTKYEQTVSVTDAALASFADAATNAAENLSATDTILTVGDGTKFTAGDIICADEETSGACAAADEQMYVVAACTGADAPHGDCTAADELVLIRGVNGTTADDELDNTEDIFRIAVLATNAMTVYETDLALSVTGPTGGSTSGSETVLEFTLVADSAGDVEIRQGYIEDADSDSTADANGGTVVVSSNVAGVGGNGLKLLATNTPITDGTAEFYQFSSGDAADYDRVSFWVKWHDAGGTAALPVDDIKFMTDDDADATAGGQSSNLGGTALVDDDWYFIDMAVPTGTLAGDDYFGLYFNDTTVFDGNLGNYILLDEIIFYNEKVNVDLALNENWAAVTPTLAYLKQGTAIVASGYVDLDSAVASRTGQITFVPVDTYADIIISGAQDFSIVMDTATAITDDSAATEKLTVTIDEGKSGTAGDIFWYTGSTVVNYTGINATDKQSTTLSY